MDELEILNLKIKDNKRQMEKNFSDLKSITDYNKNSFNYHISSILDKQRENEIENIINSYLVFYKEKFDIKYFHVFYKFKKELIKLIKTENIKDEESLMFFFNSIEGKIKIQKIKKQLISNNGGKNEEL